VDGALFVNEIALAIRAVSDGLRLMQLARVYFAPMLADGCFVTVLDDWVRHRSRVSIFIIRAAVRDGVR
jgi:hypothetical protein